MRMNGVLGLESPLLLIPAEPDASKEERRTLNTLLRPLALIVVVIVDGRP